MQPLIFVQMRLSEKLLKGVRDLESEAIRHALKQSDGKQSVAARLLGIHRVTLWRKLARYKIRA